MDALTAARIQMEVSLAFHMIFASFGIAMPLFMLIAERRWLQTGEPHYLELAKRWGKATLVLFAIGAVSGTALAFELGLLWPTFMEFAGSIIGPAFAMEAFAFFVEAIFLALYLYGWNRLSPKAHWWTGVPVAIAGAASGVLVVATNAWMQNPVGLEQVLANPEAIDPNAMLFGNPVWHMMAIHSTLSTYTAAAFAVAGIYAYQALKGKRTKMAMTGMRIALAVGLVTAVLMPVSGHFYSQLIGEVQPAKLAAMEGHYETGPYAPLLIGGWPDNEARTVRGAIGIPGLLSLMLHGNPAAEVTGLDQFPEEHWPHVGLTRTAFQVMVGSGLLIILVAAAFWVVYRRRREGIMDLPWLMRLVVAGSPFGMIALQAGWIVTEVGRQPWVIYNYMYTADAVTESQDVLATLIGFIVLYLALSAALVWLLRRTTRVDDVPEAGADPPKVPATAEGGAGR